MSKLQLSVLTPAGKRFDEAVDMVQIRADKSTLGILPNHSPLISDVLISEMIITKDGENLYAAVGEGIVSVDSGVVKVVVSSFELAHDIDEVRVLEAKQRAEERLANPDEEIDITRAKAALARALNRLNVLGRIK